MDREERIQSRKAARSKRAVDQTLKRKVRKPSPSERAGSDRKDPVYAQWKRFIYGLSPDGPLRRVILESWERSRAYGIAPERFSLQRVDEADLKRRLQVNQELIEMASLHLDWIASSLAALPHAAYLVDRDGIVLYAAGNDAEMRERFGLLPGYDWSERTMGTNGAGTALVVNQPVAVVGPEHFSRPFHDCACTGAPIHADGRVIGAIDIITRMADGNPERLILVAHIAYVIEQALMHRRSERLAEEIKTEAMTLLAHSLDYETILSSIARLAVSRLADWCAVDMAEGGTIVRRALAHADPGKGALARALRGYPVRADAAYGTAHVIRTGRSELYREVSDLVLHSVAVDRSHLERLLQMGLQSIMVVPLPGRGKILGAMVLGSAESGRRYSRVDLALAEELARRAALAVENARLYQAAQQEIAERKRSEEALKESEEKYRTLFETMTQGVVYHDADGTIISANPAAQRILGLTLDQLQGRTSFDPRWRAIHADGSNFPGEDHPAMVALRSGRAARNVVMGVFHPQEETYRWININAVPYFRPGEERPYQVYATFEDITERKEAEARLRESQERLQAIFDNTTAVVYLMGRDHRFIRINRRFETLFRLGRETVRGKSIYDFFPQEVADAFRANNEKVLEAAKPLEFDEAVPQEDGTHIYLSIKVPLFDHTGKPYAVCGISTDITDRKRMEEALRQKTIEVEEASRAKSQFVSIISHELRTPLNAIIGYSDLLRRSRLAEDETRRGEMIDRIYYNAQILLRLINNLLDLNRMEAGQMPVEAETVYLHDVIGRIVDNLKPMGEEKGLKVSLVDECGPLPIRSDSKKIEQIVTNLISNAIKFTDQGSVTVRMLDFPAEQQVAIEVSDTGIGIGEEDLPHLFEPFYQADASNTRSYEGSGLGLSIVKKFSELIGGTIQVASTPGVGTTFTVTLPYGIPA